MYSCESTTNPNILKKIQNGSLVKYQEKLKTNIELLNHIIVPGSSVERISIDLDDGVLVNYNYFRAGIKEISGLNDRAIKKKVKDIDWFDGTKIRKSVA